MAKTKGPSWPRKNGEHGSCADGQLISQEGFSEQDGIYQRGVREERERIRTAITRLRVPCSCGDKLLSEITKIVTESRARVA